MIASLRAACLPVLSAVALYVALTLPAVAVTAPEMPDPVEFTLDNGLHVVVIEDQRAPVVTQMVWYRVGSADDPVGLSGMAHYVEHLMFMATETREEGTFDATLRAQGARYNAFTSYDFTAYYQRLAVDRLEMAMELEADRMANLRIDLSTWERERSVILEERGQVLESNPQRVLAEQMRAALFRHHPYGIHPLGWRHEMERLDAESAEAFYRQHYAPNNAILIVAGAVHADDVREMAERHFGPIPANTTLVPRERLAEPPQLAERRIILHDPRVAQPSLMRMYLAPARRAGDQAEAAAFQVLAMLLGGSAHTAVLPRQLVRDQGIAVSAWAGYQGTALDHGTFSMGLVPAEGRDLQQAEDALDAVLADFIENGVDGDQLERAQVQMRAWAIYGLDDLESRANWIGSALTTGLTLQDDLDWIDTLLAVTEDEIIAAAQALDRRASVTGWLMPEAEGEQS
ncbi:MAG: M16 family metallopeptidase [Pararhodobacter sp.]